MSQESRSIRDAIMVAVLALMIAIVFSAAAISPGCCGVEEAPVPPVPAVAEVQPEEVAPAPPPPPIVGEVAPAE